MVDDEKELYNYDKFRIREIRSNVSAKSILKCLTLLEKKNLSTGTGKK